MTETQWRTWDEIEAKAKASGRIDEAQVASHQSAMVAAQRAYQLAEVRKNLGLTQADVANRIHVSQRRVSAVEHGELSQTQIGTVASYVEALGGRIKIIADFGDNEYRLA